MKKWLLLVWLVSLVGCGHRKKVAADAEAEAHGQVRLILTTDEHGWLDPLVDKKRGTARGGILTLGKRLRVHEGVDNPNVLLLSVGDMWTGPYESTVLKGEPMLKAMNLLGYDAAVVGNHDFDFGRDVLKAHADNANFAFVASNVTLRADGSRLSYLKRTVILNAGGIKVGIIGLANTETPWVTDPRNVHDLVFDGYIQTVKREVPRLKKAGADVIVALIHDDSEDVRATLPALRQAGVHAVGLGHHNDVGAVELPATDGVSAGLVACNAGSYLRSYCVVDLKVTAGKVVQQKARLESLEVPLASYDQDPPADLMKLLKKTHRDVDAHGAEVLAQAPKGIPRSGGALAQVVVKSWLASLPQAQVGITNRGGIRQDLSPGPVAVRDVISVLPFDNKLYLVRLSGKELKAALAHPASVSVGAQWEGTPDGQRRMLVGKDKKPLGDDEEVVVVINDFMYRGGDGYRFAQYDPSPVDTVIDWREPFIRYLRDLQQAGKTLDPPL